MPHIQYDRLTFENGYVYRQCDVPMHDQGLVLVRGVNLDDGGFLACGKTSMFEVFAQVQIGKGGKASGKHDLKDDIINRSVGKNFSAVLSYRVDEHRYEIRQYRGHEIHGNATTVIDMETGRNVMPRKASRAPHTWIRNEHLKIDEISFFNLVYLPQELTNVLLDGRDHERYKRLTTMFGLDVYDRLYEVIRERRKAVGGSLDDLERLEAELTSLDARIEETEDPKELRIRHRKKAKRLKVLKSSAKEASREGDELRELITKLELRRELVRQIKKIWKDSGLSRTVDKPRDLDLPTIKALEDRARELTGRHAVAKAGLDRARRAEIIEKQLSKLTGRDLADIEDDLSKSRVQLRHLQNTELPQAEQRIEIVEEMAGLSAPKRSIKDLRAKVEDLTRKESTSEGEISTLSTQIEENVCPACGRPFDVGKHDAEEMKTRLSELRARHRRLRTSLYRAKDALDAATAHSGLSERLAAIGTDRSPEDVQREIGRMRSRERKFTGEQEISRQRLEFEAQLEELPDSSLDDEEVAKMGRRATTAARRASCASKIRSRLDQVAELPKASRKDAAARLQEIEKDAADMGSNLERLSRETALLEEAFKTSEDLRERRRTVARGLDQGAAILRNRRCLDALKTAFGNQGIKRDRFQGILQEATRATVPLYSNVLWPLGNVGLELSDQSESLQFQLHRTEGNLVTRSGLLSGGERHKSGLALLFGMRDLKERHTESSANVLIVDEPFGSLDPQGTAGLLRVLRMLKAKFGSVFVISHRPEVLSDPVWDQVWWTVRENNESVLYREGLPSRYRQVAERYDRV